MNEKEDEPAEPIPIITEEPPVLPVAAEEASRAVEDTTEVTPLETPEVPVTPPTTEQTPDAVSAGETSEAPKTEV